MIKHFSHFISSVCLFNHFIFGTSSFRHEVQFIDLKKESIRYHNKAVQLVHLILNLKIPV